jgi:N-acetylmuramoyl-L-alanine amidase
MLTSRRAVLSRALAALACSPGLAMAAGVRTSQVLKVRLGGDAIRTRLVLDTDAPLPDPVIQPDASGHRILITFSGRARPTPLADGRGLIRGWSMDSQHDGARSWLTLDLMAPAQVAESFSLPPSDGLAFWRRVIDLVPAPSTPPPRHVVVDAGHGGSDTGALGAFAQEKDVTLLAAQLLQRTLAERGGYRVTLTRADDRFVSLGERLRLAKAARADLFLSLHADASSDPTVRGASAYTLSDHGAERAVARVASGSGADLVSTGPGDFAVRDLLLDFRQRAVRNRSAMFADRLLDHVSQAAPILRRGHREAGFMVLLGLDAPASLLEMGFITNPEDELRLTDPAAQGRLMQAVGSAIDAHFAAPAVIQVAG